MWGNDEFARVLQKVGSTNLESGIKVEFKKKETNWFFLLFFTFFGSARLAFLFLQVCKRQNFSKKLSCPVFVGKSVSNLF